MGSSQSNAILTSELAVTGFVLLAGIYFFSSKSRPSTEASGIHPGTGKHSAKNRRKRENNKKAKGDPSARTDVASSSETLVVEQTRSSDDGSSRRSIPKAVSPVTEASSPTAGNPSSSVSAAAPVAASSKKRKGKASPPSSSATTPSSSDILPSAYQQQASSSAGGTTASSSVADDDGWTKVGRGSDAELRASIYMASIPPAKVDSAVEEEAEEERRTLAERLLPEPVPTEVDDMLDKPAGLARVMRVVGSEEKPPSGFSWGDFEDMDASVQVDDEDGWSSVPTRLRKKNTTSGSAADSGMSTPMTSRPAQELTKKQRQNQIRRDAEKAAKGEAEKERLAKLAKHKKDLENERIKAQYSKGKLSGGMKATVDQRGNLIWE